MSPEEGISNDFGATVFKNIESTGNTNRKPVVLPRGMFVHTIEGCLEIVYIYLDSLLNSDGLLNRHVFNEINISRLIGKNKTLR